MFATCWYHFKFTIWCVRCIVHTPILGKQIVCICTDSLHVGVVKQRAFFSPVLRSRHCKILNIRPQCGTLRSAAFKFGSSCAAYMAENFGSAQGIQGLGAELVCNNYLCN